MQLLIVSLLLAYIITLYFKRNPMKHGSKFMWVRFLSWFPLGMSYAFMYMGRYNIDQLATADMSTVPGQIITVLSKADKGIVSSAGFFAYAAALFLTGPLVDRLGGKRGMIIGLLGSAVMNFLMGWALRMKLTGAMDFNLVTVLTVLYVINMSFQSLGAISTIKVKSFWFHVRERGTFSAIFGTLISLGVYFAFDWTLAIANSVDMHKVDQGGTLRTFILSAFGLNGSSISAYWYIFYIPAGFMVVWALLDMVLVKDKPEDAKFGAFETHDASTGQAAYNGWWDTIRSVLSNKTILLIGAIEFCTGILRDGTMKWYRSFGHDHPEMVVKNINDNWGLYGAIAGICGGFLAGWASDRFFHSRRAPVALWGNVLMLVCVVVIFFSLQATSPLGAGMAAMLIMLGCISVHSILSGTATADFGGRNGAATATGVADGFSKIGTSFQEITIGFLISSAGWNAWPLFLFPFTVIAILISWRMWNVLPDATKRYLKEVEKVDIGVKGSSTGASASLNPQRTT